MESEKRPTEYEHSNLTPITRKEVLSQMGKAVKKLALTAIPLVGTSLIPDKANAQFHDLETGRIINVLLQMEFVTQNFYFFTDIYDNMVTDDYRAPIKAMRKHHVRHVLKLKRRLAVLKLPVEASPDLSATYRVNNLNPKNNFDDFLQIGQILADASASLYKKSITELRELNCPPRLQRTLLRIHTLEARQAAYLRMIRSERGNEYLLPWISSTIYNKVGTDFEIIYENEDNTVQADIDVTAATSVPDSAVREAWDEPPTDQAINRLFQLLKVNYY